MVEICAGEIGSCQVCVAEVKVPKIGAGLNIVGAAVGNQPGSQPSFGIYIFKQPDSPNILKLRVERYGAEGGQGELGPSSESPTTG